MTRIHSLNIIYEANDMQKSSQVYITQHSFVHCKNFKEHGEIRRRNANISFH